MPLANSERRRAKSEDFMATTTAVPKTKTTGGSFLLEDHNLENVFTPEDFNEDQQMIVKLADEDDIYANLPGFLFAVRAGTHPLADSRRIQRYARRSQAEQLAKSMRELKALAVTPTSEKAESFAR